MDIPAKVIGFLPGPARKHVEGLLHGSGERARSGRGALTAFLIRVLSAGIAFFSQVLLARWMGSFEFGLFTTAWVWITVIGGLATLGFATSVIRYLSEYRETGQLDLARGFLRVGRTFAIVTGVLVAALGWLLIATGAITGPLVYPLGLVLAALPAYALTDFQDGVGRAQGWIDLALLPPYVFRPILLFGFIALVMVQGQQQSATTAALAAIAATWVTAAIQYFLQKRRMAHALPDGPRAFAVREWVPQSLPLLLLDGFSLMLLNLDILLLELFVTADQIGIYFAAIRTISLVSFIQFSVTAVAMPKFASLRATGRHADIVPTLREMQKWTFWPSVIGIVGLLGLGYPLLWLFGQEFTAAYPVMFVLSAGLLVRAWAGPAQSLLVVSGHQAKAAAILLLTVILNAILNLTLIPLWGILGAAAATAAALVFESACTMILCNRYFATSGEMTNGATAS